MSTTTLSTQQILSASLYLKKALAYPYGDVFNPFENRLQFYWVLERMNKQPNYRSVEILPGKVELKYFDGKERWKTVFIDHQVNTSAALVLATAFITGWTNDN